MTIEFDEIVVIDDKIAGTVATEIEALHIQGAKVKAIDNFEEVKQLLAKEKIPSVFLVDIHHGAEDNELGITIIEVIREAHPQAYIVGYSSNSSIEIKKKAVDVGADLYFEKESKEWEVNLLMVKNNIIQHFNKNREYHVCTEYYCRILEILEDSVLLHIENAKDRTKQTTRYYRKWRFNGIGIDKLQIDMPILLRNYERINKDEGTSETKIVFTEGDASYYSKPEIDWEFFENRKVEVHQPKRRGQ